MPEPVTLSRWSSSRPDERFPVHNPATGELLTIVQGGGTTEIDAAVRAAHEGFLSWSRRTPRERGTYLRKAAELVRAHADELAALECSEVGKPYSQARTFDLQACVGVFDFFASLAEELPGGARDVGFALDITTLQPYGVIGAIVPFNWPPIHTAGKTAPALAVGNAVVIKPPEEAPLTIMRIVELLREVLPDDVVHVVPGGPDAGAALTSHPLVRKVSFTGAPATGTAVIKSAAENLTPTIMELGGKNPLIVFADADLDAALAAAVEGGYFNQGEACTAASRLLVQRPVHDEMVARMTEAVPRLKVGDGADPRTHVGPLVTAAHQRRVRDYIDIGVREGAKLAAQAPLPTDPVLADGFYVAPTLFTEVNPDMRIAREEIFGPVVAVIPFEDEAEAVRIANGTDFGLLCAVFTADSERALRVGRSVEAGVVLVNNYNRAALDSPFGGTKASGYGREHAAETLREFGYTKAVRLPNGQAPVPRWPALAEILAAHVVSPAPSRGGVRHPACAPSPR
ncbi:aldehyde dehydrogenase family protein [Streptomyces sp. NPDC102274]|uniref:aldehyde dehydrogenase family protein n=1 Tax=Streptomyces sp. NPDC102274 TaxID=3366151 RepID=UPI00380F930E